jgi:hypothetical protein
MRQIVTEHCSGAFCRRIPAARDSNRGHRRRQVRATQIFCVAVENLPKPAPITSSATVR